MKFYFLMNIKNIDANYTFTKNFSYKSQFSLVKGYDLIRNQILSQHSNIYGAGELAYFNHLMDNSKLKVIFEKNKEFSINEIGSNFLKRIDALNVSAEIVPVGVGHQRRVDAKG